MNMSLKNWLSENYLKFILDKMVENISRQF